MTTITAVRPPSTDQPQPAKASPRTRTAELIAGCVYLVLFACVFFANFAVREQLVITGDAARNIADNHTLVRFSVVAFVLEVLVAWALYYVFGRAAPGLPRLTAWFRLIYAVFLGVAVVFLFTALHLTSHPTHTETLGQPAPDVHGMLALDAFNATLLVGLTCFGIHIALAGCICLRTRIASPLLGVSLVFAGAAYVVDAFAYALLGSYADHETIFTAIVLLPAATAEASFAVWLFRPAGTTPR